jgi:pyridoxamine 5'-phosphate oxidase
MSHAGAPARAGSLTIVTATGEPHGLDESEFAADPMTQYRDWYEAAQARLGAAADSLVVATADARGVPSARIVLLRGVSERGFMFFTNYDSAKGRDLAENPRAALVSHWHELDRQVRVKGRVTKATPEESVAYWNSRPRESRISAWASRQSETVGSRAQLEAAAAFQRERFGDDGDVPLPPFWGGYLVTPDDVEFWQHRDDRLHDRLRYRREPAAAGGWVLERLQP